MNITRIGATAVPYTVSWTSENAEFVGICPVARRKALCMPSSPGIGKPHAIRQREAISNGLCDLCGKSLKLRTKVSLSHARVNEKGADGPAVLQVEPLLHRECALESMKFCPSLKRDIAAGTLMVRSVTRYRVQFAIMGAAYSRIVTGREAPRVRLLNIGSEETKGTEGLRLGQKLAVNPSGACGHCAPAGLRPQATGSATNRHCALPLQLP